MNYKDIFYKTDFVLKEVSEVGYSVPFRFRYWAAAPSRFFEASFDGTNYQNCRLDDNGDLIIGFDNHNMGCGTLMVARTYYLNNQDFADGVCDEAIPPTPVVIEEVDGQGLTQKFTLRLALSGETAIDATSVVLPYYAKGDPGESAYQIAVEHGYVGTEEEWLASLHGATGATGPQGPQGAQGEPGVSGGMLFPVMNFNPEDGVLTISGLEQEIDRVRYDETTAELVIRLYN
jgi:hypothetical protein